MIGAFRKGGYSQKAATVRGALAARGKEKTKKWCQDGEPGRDRWHSSHAAL